MSFINENNILEIIFKNGIFFKNLINYIGSQDNTKIWLKINKDGIYNYYIYNIDKQSGRKYMRYVKIKSSCLDHFFIKEPIQLIIEYKNIQKIIVSKNEKLYLYMDKDELDKLRIEITTPEEIKRLPLLCEITKYTTINTVDKDKLRKEMKEPFILSLQKIQKIKKGRGNIVVLVDN